jgi:uroporphyrinogen-III synthase
MSQGLDGKRIVITASRKTEEMNTLIEKQGGTCLVRPMQGTVFLAEQEVESQIREIVEQGAGWFIFTTGMGTENLVEMADKMGLKEPFLKRIREAKVANRGYKTFAVLKKLGLPPVASDDDGTTRGLVRALESFDFAGQKVVVQLHGDAAPKLAEFLQAKGAHYTELLPYRHIAPEMEVAETLCQEISKGKVDAVCFTTAVQVQNLFSYARKKGYELGTAFQNRVVAVAVGKITAEAIEAEGVERIVSPENERMGAMIITLAQYMER